MLTQRGCDGMAHDLESPAYEVVMSPMMERLGSTIVFIVKHATDSVRLGLDVNDIDGRTSNRAKDVGHALTLAYLKGETVALHKTADHASAISEFKQIVADETLTTAAKITKIERILGGFAS